MSRQGTNFFSHRTEPKGEVVTALKLFHEHESIRVALQRYVADRTPYSEHQLHNALAGAGMLNRIERGRVIDMMKTSPHFREVLEQNT